MRTLHPAVLLAALALACGGEKKPDAAPAPPPTSPAAQPSPPPTAATPTPPPAPDPGAPTITSTPTPAAPPPAAPATTPKPAAPATTPKPATSAPSATPASPPPTPPAPPAPAPGPTAEASPPPAAPAAGAAHAKVGPGKCKMCHRVQHESWAASPHAASGLDCEGCHGNGGDYWPASVMRDRTKAIAAGLIFPEVALCWKCHADADAALLPRAHAHKAR